MLNRSTSSLNHSHRKAMMKSISRILIATVITICAQAAAAQTFVFSKAAQGGGILAEHAVMFESDKDDRASYSDVERVVLPFCDDVQKMIVSARSAGGAAMEPLKVALGTMVSVRRTGLDDIFVVAVAESRPMQSGCMPKVVSTSSIVQRGLKSGERAKIAQQPEADGSQSTWWLRRQ